MNKKCLVIMRVCVALIVVCGLTVLFREAGMASYPQIKSEPSPPIEIVLEVEETEQETQEAAPYLADIEDYEIGAVVPKELIKVNSPERYFRIYEISDEIFNRIYKLSYKEDCTIPREDLRYLKLLHYGFDGEIHVGELMVNVKVAEEMIEIFTKLFEHKYEIEKMHLVDDYDADDFASIDVNNTSAFNFRTVIGGSSLSKHAYGTAIDINPQQNPYVTYRTGSAHWVHTNSDAYIERADRDHMITHDDICYQIFKEYGYTWGGDWNEPKDYQHFEKAIE